MAFLHVLLKNAEKILLFHLREHTVDQTIFFYLNERRDTVRFLTFIIHDLSLLKSIT